MTVRVLVPLAPGVSEIQAVTLLEVLRRGGIQVVTASVGCTNPIAGRRRIRLMADIDYQDALTEWGDTWDAVVVPSGLSPETVLTVRQSLGQVTECPTSGTALEFALALLTRLSSAESAASVRQELSSS